MKSFTHSVSFALFALLTFAPSSQAETNLRMRGGAAHSDDTIQGAGGATILNYDHGSNNGLVVLQGDLIFGQDGITRGDVAVESIQGESRASAQNIGIAGGMLRVRANRDLALNKGFEALAGMGGTLEAHSLDLDAYTRVLLEAGTNKIADEQYFVAQLRGEGGLYICNNKGCFEMGGALGAGWLQLGGDARVGAHARVKISDENRAFGNEIRIGGRLEAVGTFDRDGDHAEGRIMGGIEIR